MRDSVVRLLPMLMATPLATVGVSANAPAAIHLTHSLGKQVVPTPSMLFAPISRRFSVNPTCTRTASSSPLIAIAIGVVVTKYCHARRAFDRPIASVIVSGYVWRLLLHITQREKAIFRHRKRGRCGLFTEGG